MPLRLRSDRVDKNKIGAAVLPFYNERDVEVPQLLNFVDTHTNAIRTVLDVGCFGSKYLKPLHDQGKLVDGIDLLPSGEDEKKLLQHYFIGNAVTIPLDKYDLVICLSTIEHAGIKQYQTDDFVSEQTALFKKLVESSKRFIYVSFPYGTYELIKGECVILTRHRVKEFIKLLPPKSFYNLRFYFNEAIHNAEGWTEISQDKADHVPYNPAKGGQCVCIMKVIIE
jgi:hypothetical protein